MATTDEASAAAALITDEAIDTMRALAEIRFERVSDGKRADVEIGGAPVLRHVDQRLATDLAEALTEAIRPVLLAFVERVRSDAGERLRALPEEE